METDYVFLVEEELWTKMLLQVLENNHIPCIALSVHGSGIVIKAEIPKRLKVYVPSTSKTAAENLMNELFSGDNK